MTVLVTVDVVGRYTMGRPTGVAVELSGYFLVALIFLGLSYTESRDRHITITVVTQRLPSRVQSYLGLAMTLIAIATAAWLSWFTLQPALQDYELGTVSLTGTRTPQWIPQLAIPVGLALFTVQLMRRAAEQIKRISDGAGDQDGPR